MAAWLRFALLECFLFVADINVLDSLCVVEWKDDVMRRDSIKSRKSRKP